MFTASTKGISKPNLPKMTHTQYTKSTSVLLYTILQNVLLYKYKVLSVHSNLNNLTNFNVYEYILCNITSMG